MSKALYITCAHIHTISHIHTLAQHACDVRLEFGVESQVDEVSGDLLPPASP